MRIHLTNLGAVTLLEPNNFRQLDVLIDPQPEEQLHQAVARIGTWGEDDHIWLSPSVMRFMSDHGGEPAWEAGFAKMLAYADEHDWVNAEGNVRAHLVYSDSDEVVTQDEFKAAMRALPAGVSAISTGRGDDVAGMIVSSLTSISAEPPLIGFFVHENSSMMEHLLANGTFVANVLGSCHTSLMASFLSEQQGPARFKHGDWQLGSERPPVLTDALASIECDIVNTTILGTHRLFVGKIRKSTVKEKEPMVHFNACTYRLQNHEEKAIA
ncbi:flavin reductase family protein [Halomonas sp. HMF6819]|uniref:flavin reductase family protein n=1 Tax=unclassified Halomonas TaxID=2609666 RepID=UPI00207674B2|nr:MULTISPECIES: flavin reductase family protein [unclassified Halomonas]